MRKKTDKYLSQFTRETKQEYLDLSKELKANIATTEAQISAAIKIDTAESYETLPKLKRRLEQLQELSQQAKAAKSFSAPAMADQVKLREEIRQLRARAAATFKDSDDLPSTGDGTGDGPMPAVPMAFTTIPAEAGAEQPMAMPMTSILRTS